jgi:magnesium transporter
MGLFVKRYHPPGTSPGTLHEPPPEAAPLSLRLVDYTDTAYEERVLASPDDSEPFLARESLTWIHVQGHAEPKVLRKLGEAFQVHPLALEDISSAGQRPKVDSYQGQLFVIASMPSMESGNIRPHQVSLFVGTGYLVSFHSGDQDPFEPVRKRIRAGIGTIRSLGSDYLLYALLDTVIDQGFPVLEELGLEIEALEDRAVSRPDRDTLTRIQGLKRQSLLLRRLVWPHREVVNTLLRYQEGIVQESTRIYLRDCYDHSVQIIELLEGYRDTITGLMDVYLSSASIRLGEVMRVLTLIATIFIPLTFITGLYGMNFGSRGTPAPLAMPELDWAYGYPAALLLMLGIGIGMLVMFKRRGWL